MNYIHEQAKRISELKHPFGMGKIGLVGFSKIVIDQGFLPGPVGRIGVHRQHQLDGREELYVW